MTAYVVRSSPRSAWPWRWQVKTKDYKSRHAWKPTVPPGRTWGDTTTLAGQITSDLSPPSQLPLVMSSGTIPSGFSDSLEGLITPLMPRLKQINVFLLFYPSCHVFVDFFFTYCCLPCHKNVQNGPVLWRKRDNKTLTWTYLCDFM